MKQAPGKGAWRIISQCNMITIYSMGQKLKQQNTLAQTLEVAQHKKVKDLRDRKIRGMLQAKLECGQFDGQRQSRTGDLH